tara:strand:+ start:3804 stop:4433 length:630 start_codon:yes stop_codon:yes gene_type:complete
MTDYISNFLNWSGSPSVSPPASPKSRLEQLQSEQLQSEQLQSEYELPENENWVRLPGEDRQVQFKSIISCFATGAGDPNQGKLFFNLEWYDYELLNLTEIISIPACSLAHNSTAIEWANQWSKFCFRFGSETPITGPYTFEQLDTKVALDQDLVNWLFLHQLSFFSIYLQENWHTSISMLKYLDEDILKSWGMQETPVRLMMRRIRELP